MSHLSSPRLPIPGSDDGSWGDILNQFLSTEHASDGTLKIRTDGTISSKANDSGVVHNTTNESIAGVKTFSSSPIVPTPTTSFQAANKSYVDGIVSTGAPDATTTSKGIVQLSGDLSGTAAAPTVPGLASKADTTAILVRSNNLSDLTSVTTARTNLGLGTSATANAPLTGDAASGEVVLGNDTRLTNTRIPSDGSVTTSKIADGSVTNAKLASTFVNASEKGAANGVATLASDGKVPSTQLTAGSAGHTIEDEGAPLTSRPSLNFVGAGVTVTDNGIAKTVVSIPGFSASGSVIEDWTDLGNMGSSKTLAGAASVVVRRKGTLNQACAITVSTTTNQQIELAVVQDGTGGRAVTFSGVNVWMTQSGAAPVVATRSSGSVDRLYFENIGGTVYGYWLTETINNSGKRTVNALSPSGAIAERYSRVGMTATNLSFLVSGQLFLFGIELLAGQTINSISFRSKTTAAVSPTNQWFALFDSSRNRLAITSDAGTAAWAANTNKTLSLNTPYTVLTDGLYYVGICVVATTVPTLWGVQSDANAGTAPQSNGSADTGLTTPATCPTTAASLSSFGSEAWCFVS